MQFDVNIRLYEYWHEQVKIRKKRWNNKEIKKCIENKFANRELEKRGGGRSVPRAPVVDVPMIYSDGQIGSTSLWWLLLLLTSRFMISVVEIYSFQGWIQEFKLGGGALKKIVPSGGRRENFWGISCEKSRFYA